MTIAQCSSTTSTTSTGAPDLALEFLGAPDDFSNPVRSPYGVNYPGPDSRAQSSRSPGHPERTYSVRNP
eukprot:jgi/Botrbrau1/11124/Bobra.0219s0028.1